jgi:hypothetical protein
VDLSAPAVTSVTLPDTISKGEALSITCRAEDNLPNCRAYVYYKQGGDPAFEVDSTTFNSKTDSFTVTIPGAMVNEKGLAILVKVSDGHVVSTYKNGDDSSSILDPVITVSNLVYSRVIPETSWVVFSMPCTPSEQSPKQFFRNHGTYGLHWSLATIMNQLVEYDTTADNFEMETGRLYWFATSASGTIIRIPTGYTSPVGDTFTWTVGAKKWAGVGVPFGYPVAIKDIRAATGTDAQYMSLFFYTDGAVFTPKNNTTDSLEPWNGYYIYNASDNPITIKCPPIPVEGQGAAKAALANAGEWTLGVQAEVNGFLDDQKTFGNLTGKDSRSYVVPLPPTGPNRALGKRRIATGEISDVRVSFVQNNSRYFADFRSTKEGSEWLAEVQNVGTVAGIKVDFSNLSENKPEKVAVMDDRRGLFFDVTETMQYTFVSNNKESRVLKVAAGTKAYVESRTAGYKPAPTEFALMQNYPNPFNPITSIRFTIPQIEGSEALPGAEWASLKVYNVRGQEIADLFRSPVEAGYYTVTWQGKDHAGRHCASGMYIYKLQITNKFNKSLRMMMVK